ncbi:MAG TPA: phosphoserine phosphatase SerB [Pseudomonadales bacterium]|nr:phosphoserine phosphatase SerB [Pseudomonadales bacterium]HMY96825.1 phosphoserine phosphatase SerB [Pseudomonadales bacterium]HMZ71565.1 phosphoserine phosphatase SerB [Pseudomonadales bacterium]HMZ92164.1 phosphoserine phosphatase SerB [Pseudomonadales bacterium]HNC76904.1 phosphoserine phosphatase SerB [Pseudomonadales bacterium]
MAKILLITLSGSDQPGITAAITAVLAPYDVQLLDIGQAVIHDTLSLGLLIELPTSAESSPVLKDVLFCAHELGVQVRFTPVSLDNYRRWVEHQARSRYIVTLLARKISALHLARVTRIVRDHELNIVGINRLSGRIALDADPARTQACVELSLRGEAVDLPGLRAQFLAIANELDVDIAFQEDNVFRRNRRLVAFDMDSTLIEAEVIDELAKRAGVGAEVAAITERAMRGELDFTDSFTRRVALLKGLPESVLAEVADQLPLTEGAQRLIDTLRRLGYKTAILSGGFTYFGRWLQQRLGIDHVHANELEIENGRVTGRVLPPVVDGLRKAELLRQIAAQERISLDQVIAVGDGANDLPMLNLAGLGIAFRAKPMVKESAKQSISTLGLDGILYLIGFRDRDTDRLWQQPQPPH